jgi:hypothetical protein
MKRRDLLAHGALGGLIGALGSTTALSAAGQGGPAPPDRAFDRVVEAIADLRTELREERQFGEIAPIRAAQKQYLRSNSKLPDFIEVGPDVWFQVYDWHVRWQQPISEGRDAQGRLTLALNQTLVILRPDVQATYIGVPYDAR